MKCTHPDHVDGMLCVDRAVGCSRNCACCMADVDLSHNFVRSEEGIRCLDCETLQTPITRYTTCQAKLRVK